MLYQQINPIVYFVFVTYSILFLIKAKSRNEFLIILSIFIFLQEQSAWDIAIKEIISNPIVVRLSDLVLIILVFYIIKGWLNDFDKLRVLKQNKINIFFMLFLVFATLYGIMKYGYTAIAEFRSKFFFIIVLLYIVTNVQKLESIILLREISKYLMPLILLVPLTLILKKDFTLSIENRVLSAFFYESIALGFLGGYIYKNYLNSKYKIFNYLFPFFITSSLYLSHRSVWAMIFLIISLLFITRGIKIKYSFQLGILLLTIYLILIKSNLSFFNERLLAFTNLEDDPTGKWRLLVWNTIIGDASYFGKGLGGRFEIWTSELGYIQYGTHNMYMTLLYYLGYIGLIIFILFLISIFIQLFSYNVKNIKYDSAKILSYLGFLSLVGVCIYMFAYESDLVSWIYISFGLINFEQKKKIVYK
ncbi:hypothetical protein VJY32_00135 [Ignavibacteria bacterium 4148-Me]|uniref:hypothetical protein n=1 Tax=Rosettibacter primus TaxID=3111523 RepID=UPI00336BE4EF